MKKLILLLTLTALLFNLTALGTFAEGGGEESFATPEYYGRGALAALPNAEALIYAYDAISAGIEERETSISVWDGEHPITSKEFDTALDAYRRDRVDHFWFGTHYGISYTQESVTTFTPSYVFTEEELPEKRAAFDEAVNAILAGVPSTMGELEREVYLHDTLANRITYVLDAPNAHNAYGAIVEGEAVCEGYAEALQLLLMRVGIQSFIIIGESLQPTTDGNVGHAWNYVRIGGNYYHVDLTWNDSDSLIYHAYFNVSDARIAEDHSITETAYALPVCNTEAQNYFAVYGGMLSGYTAETVADRIKASGEMRASFLLPSRSEAQTFRTWVKDNIKSISWRMGITTSYSYTVYTLGCEVHVLYEGVCSHRAAIYVDPVPESCVAGGTKAHYYCLDCERKYTDSAFTEPVTDGALYIAPTGHSYESDCAELCSNCGAERVAPHTMTVTEAGTRRHTLSCPCGKNTLTEPHVEKKYDGICDVCEAPLPQEPENNNSGTDAATPSHLTELIGSLLDGDVKTLLIVTVSAAVGIILLVAILYRLFNRR